MLKKSDKAALLIMAITIIVMEMAGWMELNNKIKERNGVTDEIISSEDMVQENRTDKEVEDWEKFLEDHPERTEELLKEFARGFGEKNDVLEEHYDLTIEQAKAFGETFFFGSYNYFSKEETVQLNVIIEGWKKKMHKSESSDIYCWVDTDRYGEPYCEISDIYTRYEDSRHTLKLFISIARGIDGRCREIYISFDPVKEMDDIWEEDGYQLLERLWQELEGGTTESYRNAIMEVTKNAHEDGTACLEGESVIVTLFSKEYEMILRVEPTKNEF